MTVMTRRQLILTACTVSTATAIATYSFASDTKTQAVYSENGIAVDGTDVVAYFTQNNPVPGTPEFTHDWNGATWRFASAANRDAFAADPESYAPQYGGYCAYAVSEGYTAATVPEAWKIVDGKLYLNYSRRVKKRWERNQAERIQNADANWPKVLN